MCPAVENSERVQNNQISVQTYQARHIPGRLNVIADKLSFMGQTIQTKWSLRPGVFQEIRRYVPGGKPPGRSVYHQVHQQGGPDCIFCSRPRNIVITTKSYIDPHAFPSIAIPAKVVKILQNQPCKRPIVIAMGWPIMPWFWDLVTMSSQIILCLPKLPNFFFQPFNQTFNSNLTNLNLHAQHLEPQPSISKPSLRHRQKEFNTLREDQPDASLIRQTSGHNLQNTLLISYFTSLRIRNCNHVLLIAMEQPSLTRSYSTRGQVPQR